MPLDRIATDKSFHYPGEYREFAGSSLPSGWLACNGQAVSRTTYPRLFAAISTAYGVGNGSTTFNLPDVRGRVIAGTGQGSGLTVRSLGDKWGTETESLTAAQNGAHTHGMKRATSLYLANGTVYSFPGAVRDVDQGDVTEASGSGSPHSNTQPTIAATVGIFAG